MFILGSLSCLSFFCIPTRCFLTPLNKHYWYSHLSKVNAGKCTTLKKSSTICQLLSDITFKNLLKSKCITLKNLSMNELGKCITLNGWL